MASAKDNISGWQCEHVGTWAIKMTDFYSYTLLAGLLNHLLVAVKMMKLYL